jgi:hypothetical protein
VLFLFIGILIYIPCRLFLKRRLINSNSGSDFRLHITSSGFALAALMVFVLVLGFSQQHLAPKTEFGKFIGTGIGFMSFLAAVWAGATIFGLILTVMGFKLFRHSNT